MQHVDVALFLGTGNDTYRSVALTAKDQKVGSWFITIWKGCKKFVRIFCSYFFCLCCVVCI